MPVRRRPVESDEWLVLMAEIITLFSGAPVAEEQLFAGRLTEVRRILDAVFEPSRHVLLFGERGVGKTSLSNIFWRRYNTTLKSVIAARVQADPSDSFSSLWIKALEELVATAHALDRSGLLPLNVNYDVISPDAVRRELQKCRPNASPILIIDEFDKLRDKAARELTANVIKYLYDYSANITVILVGVAEDVSQLISDHESIRRAITQIKLERMPESELGDIIDRRLSRTAMDISREARSAIITLSRGLPYFTQMLGKFAALQAARSRRLHINAPDVETAMESFIEEEDQTFRDQYRLATESNQTDNLFPEVLLSCALAENDESGFFTPTDVLQPLNSVTGEKKQHAHFQRHLGEFITERRGRVLERRGIPRKYRYRFSDPMMQPYVIIKGIRDGMVSSEAKRRLLTHDRTLFSI